MHGTTRKIRLIQLPPTTDGRGDRSNVGLGTNKEKKFLLALARNVQTYKPTVSLISNPNASIAFTRGG